MNTLFEIEKKYTNKEIRSYYARGLFPLIKNEIIKWKKTPIPLKSYVGMTGAIIIIVLYALLRNTDDSFSTVYIFFDILYCGFAIYLLVLIGALLFRKCLSDKIIFRLGLILQNKKQKKEHINRSSFRFMVYDMFIEDQSYFEKVNYSQIVKIEKYNDVIVLFFTNNDAKEDTLIITKDNFTKGKYENFLNFLQSKRPDLI